MKRPVLPFSILAMSALPVALAAILAIVACGGEGKAASSGKGAEPAGRAAATAPAPAAPAAPKPAPPLPADVADLAPIAKPGGGPAASASERPTAGEVAASGELVSPVRSELAVRLPGRVGRVFVDEGDRVRRGQPLLQLETEYLALNLKRAQADVARAEAAAADARRDFDRKKELIANDSVSRASYDRSESAYGSAQAAVEAAVAGRDLARQQLADAVLRSPIDGAVAERRTDVGERLSDNSVAFVLVQTSPLRLRFQLPERYLSALHPGQPVRAQVDPYPAETFSGRVTRIGRVIDPATRTVSVETEFANQDGRLSPGLFARVVIDLGAREE